MLRPLHRIMFLRATDECSLRLAWWAGATAVGIYGVRKQSNRARRKSHGNRPSLIDTNGLFSLKYIISERLQSGTR